MGQSIASLAPVFELAHEQNTKDGADFVLYAHLVRSAVKLADQASEPMFRGLKTKHAPHPFTAKKMRVSPVVSVTADN